MADIDGFCSFCSRHNLAVVRTGFNDYLRDESKSKGFASVLIRARNHAQVVIALQAANVFSVPITVTAARSSVTGASVPITGAVLDVCPLNSICMENPETVGPGTTLSNYKELLSSLGLFYPPDPTSERIATIGGTVATNASGALGFLYGPTRDYIQQLKVVLPTGNSLLICRGQYIASNHSLDFPVLNNDGHMTPVKLPVPKFFNKDWSRCKGSLAVSTKAPFDAIDLFVGTEGIFGVITEVTTRLMPTRNPFFALFIHICREDQAIHLIRELRSLSYEYKHRHEIPASLGNESGKAVRKTRFVYPSCMEWVDSECLTLVRRNHDIHDHYGSLYVEQEYPTEEIREALLQEWHTFLEAISQQFNAKIHTEVAVDERSLRKMKSERARIPEILNEMIRPGMIKIGTDFSVPFEKLGESLTLYKKSLPKGNSFVFGHIGNAHLHANILARNCREQNAYFKIVEDLAAEVINLGGNISGEHGIGKLKREAFKKMIGEDGLDQVRRIKSILDPQCILNRGNLFSPKSMG